jgi:RNA polymerase primary sigma factor
MHSIGPFDAFQIGEDQTIAASADSFSPERLSVRHRAEPHRKPKPEALIFRETSIDIDQPPAPIIPDWEAEITSKTDNRDEPSALRFYLNAIGQIPLLSADEEKHLAIRTRRGDEAAREHLIKANLRLVVKIAFDYSYVGLPVLDLISEGNLGLVKAVGRFDHSRGNRLSTYAAWWIKQSIHFALANQLRTIRIPVHLAGLIARVREFTRLHQEEFGRDPDNAEIANELQIPVSKIALLDSVCSPPTSLHAPLFGDSDSRSVGDIVCDTNARSPDEHLRDKSLMEDLHAAVLSLDPREARILTLRFGLNGEEPSTLEELGRKFDVTRERIRQLECMSLRKVRRRMKEQNREPSWGEFKEAQDVTKRAKAVRALIARHSARLLSA